MNRASMPVLARNVREDIGNGFAAALADALRHAAAQWRVRRARARDGRAAEAFGEMSSRLLRDIGAPETVIARAVSRRGRDKASSWPLLASAAIACVTTLGPSAAVATDRMQSAVPAAAHVRSADRGCDNGFAGAPVYRLPSITVVGRRDPLPVSVAPGRRAADPREARSKADGTPRA